MTIGESIAIGALILNLITTVVALTRHATKVASKSESLDSTIKGFSKQLDASVHGLTGSLDKLRDAVDRLDNRTNDHAVRLAVLEAIRKQKDHEE